MWAGVRGGSGAEGEVESQQQRVVPMDSTHREQGFPQLLHKVLWRQDSQGRSVDECALQRGPETNSDFSGLTQLQVHKPHCSQGWSPID